MRERSHTTPRRRGPKLPIPHDTYNERYDASVESPYYTIDNTEDIYGTTLLPSQRCYVDPWDLENYDYVRKKLNTTPSPSQSPGGGYYDTTTISPSPAGYYLHQALPPPPRRRDEEEFVLAPRMSATMPRKQRRHSSHWNCELECCAPPTPQPRHNRLKRHSAGGYEEDGLQSGHGRYEDYMMHMTEDMMMQPEEDIYTGYGGFSSSSSTERHSSIDEECGSNMMLLHTPGSGAVTARKRSVILPKPAPKLEFPAPPPVSPTYDYCNPYATLPYSPYCSVSDCYECLSQAQQGTSLIYAAPSMYGTSIYGGATSTLGRRPSSSLYGGIYGNKFGLSKKGLLQIDYSCSWNDLDRVMGRNY